MSFFKKLLDGRPHVSITIQGVSACFLLDSGASKSLISSKLLAKFQRGFAVQTTDIRLETITGQRILTDGRTVLSIDHVGPQDFIAIPDLQVDGLLGNDFLQKYHAVVDYDKREVAIGRRKWVLCNREVNTRVPTIGKVTDLVEVPHWLEGIQDHSVFRDELGHCNIGPPLHVATEGPPIKQRPYRQPLVKRKIVEEEIQKLLEADVIQPSSSPWASPITLVPKKDGSSRFCIDYRKVNNVTVKDSYPLPHVQDIFDTLNGASIFTTVDLRSGYWQVDLNPETIPKTAFVCHKGLYEFKRLPMGLTNAPSQFQRLMDLILSDLNGKICLVYIDDIIIFSRSRKEHIEHVRLVLDRLASAGLTLKHKKCHFGKTEVELLGYTVSAQGIAPQRQKTEVINKIPRPTTVKEIRSFLGMTGYYRQCIPRYAEIAEPLVALTKKGARFSWNDNCEVSFHQLKEELCSSHVMAHPDPGRSYIVHTDACDYAVGAILTQEKGGIDRPIQYVSKKLTETQKRWAPVMKEAYAIVYALKKLRPYLQGADFVIYTDHKPLKSLFSSEMKNSMIQRWAMQISEFGCRIEYRKGKHNVRADMLSRLRIDAVNVTLRETDYSQLQRQEFPAQWAEAETADEDSENILMDGELYSMLLPHQHAVECPRLLVPNQFREGLIDEAHLDLCHRSWQPTLRYIQSFCVWPGMTKQVKDRLELCPHCQGNRRAPKPSRLQLTETPNRPFYRLGADLIGPFLPSPDNHRYILTVVDHLTGWAEALPLKDKCSKTIWENLECGVFTRFGYPVELITDNGSEFTAHDVREKYRAHGIVHLRSTPKHPQTNGVTERFNKSLKNTLHKMVNNAPGTWYQHLPYVLWGYRMSEQTGRGTSPYQALFGNPPNCDLPQAVTDRHEHIARVQREVHDKQECEKRRRQARGPQTTRNVTVGDYVTLTDDEVVTLAHLRQHAYVVRSVKGKVIGIQKIGQNPYESPAEVKYVSYDRVREVPAAIDWRDVAPRVRRRRGGPDVRTLTFQELQTAPVQEPAGLRRRATKRALPTQERLSPVDAKRQRIEWVCFVRSFFSVRP